MNGKVAKRLRKWKFPKAEYKRMNSVDRSILSLFISMIGPW